MTESQHSEMATQRTPLQKGIALIAATALAASVIPILPASEASATPAYIGTPADAASTTGELIVVYENDALGLTETATSSARSATSLENIGAVGQTEIAGTENTEATVTVIELANGIDERTAIDEIADLEEVRSVHQNFKYSLMGAISDPYSISDASEAQNQYYLYDTKAIDAWDHTRTDSAVTIAVLDTGCDLSHEDLSARIDIENAYDATTRIPLSSLQNGDANGHGTQVAGIIAAQADNAIGIAGISYNANILPIKVFDENSQCTTADLLAAYDYLEGLIESGQVTDLKAINLSIGYYAETLDEADEALRTAIATMRAEHNVLTVCAGGNGDASGKPRTAECYPADFEGAISVTALDESGANASFADYNAAKDISAPGVNILTTDVGNSYAKVTGSSMAAPIVAGAAALLWSADPSLSASQIEAALTTTAAPITGNVHPESGSAGQLDVLAALGAVTGEAYDATEPPQPIDPDRNEAEQAPDANENAVMGSSQESEPAQAVLATDSANSWRFADGEAVTPNTEGTKPISSRIEPLAGTYSWYKEGNTWYTTTNVGTSKFAVSNAAAFGIDVSEHQGYITWSQAKRSGVQFAIIRCGYGSNYANQDDKYWLTNVRNCINSGVPFGVYIYSYAQNVAEASSEADHVLRCLEKAELSPSKVAYPIYYDLEERSMGTTGNRALLAQMAQTFCDKISKAGYMPGVYANQYWWDTYLTDPTFNNWEKWVAQYPYNGSTGTTYKGIYGMWQCMSKGNIPGISTNVDINFAYDIVNANGNHMYRMYNPNSGEHFYTAMKDERNMLIRAGWRYEGVAWVAPHSSKTPVYRLYNPNAGDHHYTTSAGERDVLITKGWRSEGIGWYSDDAKGKVLYRLYNPNARAGAHHYTLSAGERDVLIRAGWRYEGTCWHGMK